MSPALLWMVSVPLVLPTVCGANRTETTQFPPGLIVPPTLQVVVGSMFHGGAGETSKPLMLIGVALLLLSRLRMTGAGELGYPGTIASVIRECR